MWQGVNYDVSVSIHALLAECDCNGGLVYFTYRGFNPRTPCGVRRFSSTATTSHPLFQSTHSLRSATIMITQIKLQDGVSIHALLAECDAHVAGR